MEVAWTMVLGRLKAGVVAASDPSAVTKPRARRPKRRRTASRVREPVVARMRRSLLRSSHMELWTMRIPEIGTVVAQAERAERLGWDGITFTDSQNLVGDPFVAVALAAAATERLRFATGVTNAYTRHPAALANVAATVQETSGGRFVLGIGRGDTALFHLGLKPMPVVEFIDVGHRSAALPRQRHDRLQRPSEPVAVARPVPSAEGPARHRGVGPADDRVRRARRRARHARGRRRSRSRRLGDRPRAQGRGRRRARSRRRSRSART